MNKISDLKIGGEVVTKRFGKGTIYSKLRTGELGKDTVAVKVLNLEVKNTGCPFFYEHEIDWQKTTELNNKQMKEFIIECPSGYEIDKEKSTFEKIVFKEIGLKFPESVEEIPNREWYISSNGSIEMTCSISTKAVASIKDSEAFLARM